MLPEYKYRQIYNPKSNRLPNYDYRSNWWYFITICTKNRENYFGEIIDGKMILNEMWKIAEKYYLEIIEHFPFVILDEFVIMPNHIHFIAVINNPEEKEYKYPKGLEPLIKKSISSFANQFKGVIKKWCNKNGFENFEWQSKFHDRIIRNEDEYKAIRYYIRNNIKNWENDKEL